MKSTILGLKIIQATLQYCRKCPLIWGDFVGTAKLRTQGLSMEEATPFSRIFKNPSIYNKLRWVAWTMGQTNRRPRV